MIVGEIMDLGLQGNQWNWDCRETNGIRFAEEEQWN